MSKEPRTFDEANEMAAEGVIVGSEEEYQLERLGEILENIACSGLLADDDLKLLHDAVYQSETLLKREARDALYAKELECAELASRLHDCQQLLAQHEASAERRAYDDDVRDRISELESAEARCPKCAHRPSERLKACPHEDCPSGEYAR